MSAGLLFLTPLAFFMSTLRNSRMLVDQFAFPLGLVFGPLSARWQVGLAPGVLAMTPLPVRLAALGLGLRHSWRSAARCSPALRRGKLLWLWGRCSSRTETGPLARLLLRVVWCLSCVRGNLSGGQDKEQ
jgi:hypothetical protein